MACRDNARGPVLAPRQLRCGESALMRLGYAGPQRQIQYIPPGALPLDLPLGVGGFPKGRIIESNGTESDGNVAWAPPDPDDR